MLNTQELQRLKQQLLKKQILLLFLLLRQPQTATLHTVIRIIPIFREVQNNEKSHNSYISSIINSSLAAVSVSALSFDDLYAWVRSEEISVDETTETEDTSDTEVSETEETDDTGITTTIVTTTVEETESQTATTTTDGEKEQLKKQIWENAQALFFKLK